VGATPHARHPFLEHWRQMLPFLILARTAIISRVPFSVMPFEIAHDAIEAELKRRGIEL